MHSTISTDYVHTKLAKDKRKRNKEVRVLREEASELNYDDRLRTG